MTARLGPGQVIFTPVVLALPAAPFWEAVMRCLSALPLLLLSAPVWAEIEEITVTAQGRAESLAEAAASIAVFAADDVSAKRLHSVEDIAAATPGVYVINDQDLGTNIITIRGVSTDRLQAPSVAFIIDGVPLADTELFTPRLYDIAQIEVLKGPQGALYGRNAAGGVIDIVTAPPPDSFAAGAVLELANGGSREARFSLGGPVYQDAVRLSLSGYLLDSDGLIENSFLETPVDFLQSRGLRARVEAEPADRLELSLAVNLLDEDGGAAYVSSGDVVGDFGGRLDGEALTDPFGDFLGRSARSWFHAAAKAARQTDWGRIDAMIARDSYDKDFIEELDFRNDRPVTFFGAPVFPDGIQPVEQPVDLDIWTAELRFSSTDGQRLRWTFGGFFQDVRRVRVDDFGPLLFGAEAPRSVIDSTQWAIFGELAADLTDMIELRAALRYDRDDRAETVAGVSSGAIIRKSADVFDDLQPKLTLAWRPGDRLTAYATYGEGFKTGAFNPVPVGVSVFAEDVPAEKTRAVELGAKTRWFGGRLGVDAALFATWISDYQSYNFIDGQSVILSADRVRIRGWEAMVTAIPLSGLELTAGASGNDAEIVDFQVPDPFGSAVPLDFSGNQVPNSPRWTLNLSAAYETELPAGLSGSLRFDYRHTGRVNYQPDNALFSPDHGFLDARLALSGEHWEAALWARNLTDERRAISAFSQTLLPLLAGLGPGGPFDSFTLNRPRQWGATFSVQF